MGQSKGGWLLIRNPLSDDGKLTEWRSIRYKISFLFGVLQSGNLHDGDDLKHSMANLTRTVGAPIQLVSWGNIDQISRILAADGGDWERFKAGHKAAYKQLPIDPSDQAAAIVAHRHPGEHRRYGFVSRALISGLAAVVLRYNVLSSLLFSLANRYLGIPLAGYLDDFSAIIIECLGEDAPDT